MDGHSEAERAAYFPYHNLGLRSNPFRVLTEAEWMEVAILPPYIESLMPGGFVHLQILGDSGWGKTTTLLGIRHAFLTLGRSITYEYLPPGRSHFETMLDDISVFILDEAQRLSRREIRRLLSRAASACTERPRLVLSSHRDLSSSFHRRGLPLQTHTLDQMSVPLLQKLLTKRLEYFSLTGNEQVRFTEESVTALVVRFGRDLRALEEHLYEIFQMLVNQRSISDGPSPLLLSPRQLEAP